jgi:hypothetical protein
MNDSDQFSFFEEASPFAIEVPVLRVFDGDGFLTRLLGGVLCVRNHARPVVLMSRRIRLPNGLFLRYDDVPVEDLWGGKLLEHLCQSLARVIIMQAALRISQRGYRFCLQVHDDLVFGVPDDQIEDAKMIIAEEMTRPPAWMPDLPLAVEVKQGSNYGNCEI